MVQEFTPGAGTPTPLEHAVGVALDCGGKGGVKCPAGTKPDIGDTHVPIAWTEAVARAAALESKRRGRCTLSCDWRDRWRRGRRSYLSTSRSKGISNDYRSYGFGHA